jgi:hypothetical protein
LPGRPHSPQIGATFAKVDERRRDKHAEPWVSLKHWSKILRQEQRELRAGAEEKRQNAKAVLFKIPIAVETDGRTRDDFAWLAHESVQGQRVGEPQTCRYHKALGRAGQEGRGVYGKGGG